MSKPALLMVAAFLIGLAVGLGYLGTIDFETIDSLPLPDGVLKCIDIVARACALAGAVGFIIAAVVLADHATRQSTSQK